MVTPELLDFLRAQVASGGDMEHLRKLLRSDGGWDDVDVDEAFRALGVAIPIFTPPPPPPPPTPTPPSVIVPPPDAVALRSDPMPHEIKKEVTPEIITLQPPSNTLSPAPGTTLKPVVPETKSDVITNKKIEKPFEVPISAEEDFLGIFHGMGGPIHDEPLPVLVSEAPSPEMDGLTTEGARPSSAGNTPLDRPEKPTPKIERGIVPHPEDEEKERSSRSLEDMLLRMEEKQHPKSSASRTGDVSTPDVKVSPVFKFDIHALDNPVAPPEEGSQEEKPVVTKSMAEAWVEHKPVEPAVEKEEKVDGGESHSPTAQISRKRTMASDLLLRGMGSTVSVGVPSMNVPPREQFPVPGKIPPPENAGKEERDGVKNVPVRTTPLPPPPSSVTPLPTAGGKKRTLFFGLVIFISVIALGGATYAYMFFSGSDSGKSIARSLTTFLALPSFSYTADINMDLALENIVEDQTRVGTASMKVSSSGKLRSGKDGYGDGVHELSFKGQLSSGNSPWSSDVSASVLVIGKAIYFHVNSLPESTDLDPEIFKKYWVKLTFSELASELSLPSSSLGEEGYGNFGSAVGDTFPALLTLNMPFVPKEDITTSEQRSAGLIAVKLGVDEDKMVAFIAALYKKIYGKDLAMNDEEKANLRSAMAKVGGEVVAEKDGGALRSIRIAVALNDDIARMRVRGPLSFSFTFSDPGVSVTPAVPSPALSREELRVLIESQNKLREVRARDGAKIAGLREVESVLASYYVAHRRYPPRLTPEIFGTSSASMLSSVDIKTIAFASYENSLALDKAHRCGTKSKTCDFYHIGVSVEDKTNPALDTDKDVVSEIYGNDSVGCANERDMACFDETSPPIP